MTFICYKLMKVGRQVKADKLSVSPFCAIKGKGNTEFLSQFKRGIQAFSNSFTQRKTFKFSWSYSEYLRMYYRISLSFVSLKHLIRDKLTNQVDIVSEWRPQFLFSNPWQFLRSQCYILIIYFWGYKTAVTDIQQVSQMNWGASSISR